MTLSRYFKGYYPVFSPDLKLSDAGVVPMSGMPVLSVVTD
jgi:hypothetical protein